MQTSPLEFRSSGSVPARLSGSDAPAASLKEGGITMAQDLEIRLFDRMEPLEADWRKLEAEPANSLHQAYDWCCAWTKTHHNPLAIIHGRRNGETAFILPLEIVQNSMVRCAQFIAARFNNINSGLFSAAFRANAGAAEAEQIRHALVTLLSGKADLVSLANVAFEWRGERHPLSTLPAIENQNRSFQLPLLGDFELTLGQLNARRRRKKFRSQCRRLESTGGYQHVIARTATEKSAMLETFFEQKAIRFKALGIPNVFQPRETQAFFRMLLEVDNSSHDTPLELHAIQLKGEFNGRIVAIAGMSRKAGHVICQFGSIDDSVVSDVSPGELLFWLMIEQGSNEGDTLFDFGLGDQEYKRRWCTIETVQHDILIPINLTGRLAAIAQHGVTWAKTVIKSNPQLYAVIQRLRARADDAPARPSAAED